MPESGLTPSWRPFEQRTPYPVDIRAHDMPGWPLDPPFEQSMRRDAIDLSSLANDADPSHRGPTNRPSIR